MLEKHKLLSLIIAMILVPVLLGTTPMNLVQRLSNPLPQSLDKQIDRCSSCFFNSIGVQHEVSDILLDSYLLELNSADPMQIRLNDLVSFDISPEVFMLRC